MGNRPAPSLAACYAVAAGVRPSREWRRGIADARRVLPAVPWRIFLFAATLHHRRYSDVMRPLRYSINVTLDGCCDHRAMFADKDLHRHAVENLAQADALIFGRVTYEMMEAAWRPPAPAGARPD